MRIATSLLSAAVVVAAAQPHGHSHQHAHLEERQFHPDNTADVIVVPGPTEVAYVLNGHAISEQEVEEGVRNGTLVFAQDGAVSSASSSASSSAPPSSAAAPTTSSTTYAAPATSSSAPAYSAPGSSSSSTSSSGSGSNSNSASTSGVNTPFPDGQLSCSTFPSQYGAVSVDWIGLGGWTGIQSPGSNNGGYSDIMTQDKNTCPSGTNCCQEGMFCSYACPAGYQKSQWPSTQGKTGQSVGGLLCSGGKLHLTNPSLTGNLCMTGASEVTVLINNTLSSNVAVCRTDYPGTEGETVPVNTQPNSVSNLTCPDASNYYTWEGGFTSAQYYVNPYGVPVADACQWGSSANPTGNWAPLNLGVGYTGGNAWLSIFQNLPTTSELLNFTVEVVGDNLAGKCRYSNGQYCGGENYQTCSSTTGCTVSMSSGTATFVFSYS
ncbi:hypothetical protein BAUCODRAFT_65876 [Baudoinia panamericana UAMH 10762]|uniref:Glycoside hydrolase family 132 protein n=1 Tax=Baudoinia panamericana (strain UAMH 10762) TaxID=717646 RepID=M2NJL0_BAUPA|nr:uncharacterized protein BAUCODRAFT_65876 [Baudoinia panamericana UAMH 10762]EMC99330.1 hypothetical protein BAUCODRAFT_65876 [Baudoinia panamericana UAMH 10762]